MRHFLYNPFPYYYLLALLAYSIVIASSANDGSVPLLVKFKDPVYPEPISCASNTYCNLPPNLAVPYTAELYKETSLEPPATKLFILMKMLLVYLNHQSYYPVQVDICNHRYYQKLYIQHLHANDCLLRVL